MSTYIIEQEGSKDQWADYCEDWQAKVTALEVDWSGLIRLREFMSRGERALCHVSVVGAGGKHSERAPAVCDCAPEFAYIWGVRRTLPVDSWPTHNFD